MTNPTNPLLAALEPCPFCKGKGVMRRDDDPQYPWYVTFDHEPDCVMYAIPTDLFRSFETDAQAASAWNRRALSSAPAVGEPVATQWRACQDGSPRTSWKPVGYGTEEQEWDLAAAQDKRITVERRPLYAHPTAAVAGEGQPIPDDSLRAMIGELGNQIHNLGCEHQGDEALADRLEELRTEAWRLAGLASPAALSQPAGDALLHDKEK